MASSKAKTIQAYLSELPEDRRAIIRAVRDVIVQNLGPGFVEVMNWGMICYEVPLSRYPDTYNKKPLGYAALAAQKHYCAVYLTGIYQNAQTLAEFRAAFARAGKKLDMGKCCVRFKTLDDLPLDAVGKVVASQTLDDFLAMYEKMRSLTPQQQRALCKIGAQSSRKSKPAKPRARQTTRR
jgi:hypothetical protein